MTDLLRHMMRAAEAGGWGSAGATALGFGPEAAPTLELELEAALAVL